MKTIKMLMVFVMIVLGLSFVGMNLSGCSTTEGIKNLLTPAPQKNCPSCNKRILYYDRYENCPWCNAELKWEK